MDGLRDVDLQSQTPAIVEMEAPEAVVLRAEAQRMLSPDALHWLKKVDERTCQHLPPPPNLLLNTAQPHPPRLTLGAVKHFLIFAPSEWQQNEDMRRFPLFSGDFVSCVLWDSIFYITGTDIVRCVSFRVHAFGRRVENFKKFEEGVFSDLRYLKPGTHASLEKPRSQFLDFLFKNRCIRTKKKQKVFFWYSVPHDRLFLDALERDIRREKMGQVPTSVAVAEPALSFQHEPSKSLYERLVDTSTARHSSNAWQLDFAHQKLMAPREDATEPMPHQSMIADTHQQPAALRETVAGALPHQDMMAAIRAGSISSYDGLETDPLNFTAVSREFPVAGFQCHQNDVHFHGQPHHTQTMLTGLDYSPHPTIPSSHQFHYGVSPPQHTAGVYTQLADILDGAHPNQFTGLPTMTHHPPWNVTAPQLPSACGQTNLYWVQQVSPTYKRRRRRRYGSAGSVGVSASAPSDHEAHHGPIALKKSASEASSTVSQPETPEKPEMTAHKDPHVVRR